MKNTPYFGVDQYNQSWFHMDQFYEDSCDSKHANLDKGMSLIIERKYDLLTTNLTGAQYNWYTHAICQKDLHIGSNMIQYQ